MSNINLPDNNIDLEEVFYKQHLNKQIRDANLHRILVHPELCIEKKKQNNVLFGNEVAAIIVSEDFEKILLEGI